MLGKFLELSLQAADTPAAWQRFLQLGWVEASPGDIYSHAYGVVSCDGFAIGLHAKSAEPLSITFVRPDVVALHRELGALDVRVETAQLGSDRFNELTLREPGGMQLRVLEARSFSPPANSPTTTLLGRCLGLSLPCRDLSAAGAFWSALHAVPENLTQPWEGFGLTVAPLRYHLRRAFPEPALIFELQADASADKLTAAGLSSEGEIAALSEHNHRLLRAPEELALIVLL
jgi:hypothetical protein